MQKDIYITKMGTHPSKINKGHVMAIYAWT